jgi:hypothetical protein
LIAQGNAVEGTSAMPLVCPQCKQLFEDNGVCPLCNLVLMYQAPNLKGEPAANQGEDEQSQWQQTPWGKIVIGLIMAQGLNFGMEHLVTAGFLATGDGTDVWGTLWGLVMHHGVLAFSLLLGGALSGAGQSRGIIYGALVGLSSGIISVCLHYHKSGTFSSMLIYAEPIIHLATGAVGGALGMLIWRPMPRLHELEGSSSGAPLPGFGFLLGNMFSGPVHMGRVCAGAFVIVVGVVWSQAIMEFLLRASNGSLALTSKLQAQLVSLEIIALVVLIGAGFAGATTRNGIKQGLCVGLAASAIVLGVQIGSPRFVFEGAIASVAGIVSFALVGGWFGGNLFPPIAAGKRKRSFSSYA